ncbi:MAG: penicillin-binding protein 1C [Pseudomonadota bacterium]
MIWLRRIALAAALLAGALVALDWAFPPPIERARDVSIMVTDREGRPLRALPLESGTWRFAADLDEIDPVFVDALLDVEDKRFWRHGGVDWLGMVRAVWTSARAGRVVSGGSTITMQTARLLEPRPRNVGSKLVEMWRAHQIEARLSKQEILELYLTLTPYGGNLEGIRAASWRYFGRAPDRLSDDQIALLIALPQSPEVRRPDLRPQGARAGRQQIVSKLNRLGFLSDQRAREVNAAPLPSQSHAFPARAWHAAAQAARGASGDIVSTLDAGLQGELERIASRVVAELEPQVQVSFLVVEAGTKAVRGAVGSASRHRPGGWLDLTNQPRSPGSTLKPFIYAMAFDDGLATPQTKIADLPQQFAAYRPENFDRLFRGDVRISQALQHSLNVPAVMTLDKIGPDRFAASLSMAGAHPRVARGAEQASGLALALGGAGLTARELAVLYAALGDNGSAKPLVWREDQIDVSAREAGHRIMSERSAAEISQILKETPAPMGRIPGRLTKEAPQVAFKTGTSYGYRDAWAAGVSGDHVIVVWVGRADGAPRPGVTGRKAALPLLFELADRAAHHLTPVFEGTGRLTSPENTPAIGALATFSDQVAPPHILFPPADAELWAGTVGGRAPRPFVFAGRGDGGLEWYIDGELVDRDAGGLPAWQPQSAGFYRVSAVDKAGRQSAVTVRVLKPTD